MYFHWFYGIFVQIFCHFLLSASLPVDVIIIQIQKMSVIGAQHVSEQVLLNGVPLTSSRQEVKDLIKSMSADTILSPIDIDQISALRGHTILRSRECILEGGQLHWADRMFNDDEEYLTLDHNDTWAVRVPQALALKALLDKEVQHTRTERIHLQEGCFQLMKELQLSEERSVPGVSLPQILIPILGVVAFILLIIVSILLSIKEGSLLAGGVLGSIIHYPRDMTDMTVDKNRSGYRTL
ncbi:uncharacterized protein LOC121643874 [Melanotaenia boesemani]|uniref:uncharacterized protein LOC121643874 n=1 Tax=Melanotaenia boesemani TaxID=1250792 RepID=UPI001C0426C7|nr:uncharacterized protein LOC121643874 [Melanotaenia boesemani]